MCYNNFHIVPKIRVLLSLTTTFYASFNHLQPVRFSGPTNKDTSNSVYLIYPEF